MDSCPPLKRATVAYEISIIQRTTAAGISTRTQRAGDTTWNIWEDFCHDLHQDPTLANIDDPIPLLQLFAQRYRLGEVAPSGHQVRSRTVEGALRAIGQAFSALGFQDPRLTVSGKLDFRLSRQLSAYKKTDPPPHRVKPIPFPIIAHATDLCRTANTPYTNALADMLILGFFFLLRPGEYAATDNPDSTPFRFKDVHLLINARRLNPYTATDGELNQVNFLALEFTNQKNGVRGELIGLGRSGHPRWCPVYAIISRIRHLRAHNAAPQTPIYQYYNHSWHSVTSTMLTNQLRIAITALGPTYGIQPLDVSVRSLRASGAMALLSARVDTDVIRLLGRWRSDEMLRYLHVQSFPLVAPLASQMLRQGTYTLIPRIPING